MTSYESDRLTRRNQQLWAELNQATAENRRLRELVERYERDGCYPRPRADVVSGSSIQPMADPYRKADR